MPDSGLQSYWQNFSFEIDKGGIWVRIGHQRCYVLRSQMAQFLAYVDQPETHGKFFDALGFRKEHQYG